MENIEPGKSGYTCSARVPARWRRKRFVPDMPNEIDLGVALEEFVAMSTGNSFPVIRSRTNRHSSEPDHRCGEIYAAFEVNGSAVITCCETAEVLHSVEAALDAVPLNVDGFIVRDDDFARAV